LIYLFTATTYINLILIPFFFNNSCPLGLYISALDDQILLFHLLLAVFYPEKVNLQLKETFRKHQFSRSECERVLSASVFSSTKNPYTFNPSVFNSTNNLYKFNPSVFNSTKNPYTFNPSVCNSTKNPYTFNPSVFNSTKNPYTFNPSVFNSPKNPYTFILLYSIAQRTLIHSSFCIQ